MDLEFNNVTYTTVVRKLKVQTIPRLITNRLEILHSVSGKFHAGQLTAILGPSGAGKTCLLNALSDYRSKGVGGEFMVDGRARNSREFHRLSCYITQDDLLQPMLTVGELMSVAATLKLPASCSREEKRSIVASTLKNLGLSRQKDTRTEKLSGGERKRLSIALEMVNNPPIFFLDEPTSGLDQVTTVQCIRLLKMLAKQGRTVICTIHQPSASMLEMFDQLYVIAKGCCIYRGTPDALVPFLANVGLDCPHYFNPADYVMELTENSDNIKKLCSVTQNGKISQSVPKSIENGDSHLNGSKQRKLSMLKLSKDTDLVDEYASSSMVQFNVLLRRMLTQTFRNRFSIKIQLLHHILCAALVGVGFYKSTNDAAKIVNNMRCCLGICMFFSYTQIMVPVLVYPTQVKLVKKEYFNRWYRLLPYYLAMTVSKLPLQIAMNLVFCFISFFWVGLPHEAYRLFMFCFVGNMISIASEGMGIAIGSTFNTKNGSSVGPMTLAPMIGLAIYGFDFAKNISWFMNAVMKTSFMRLGLVAIAITVFGMDRKPLECKEAYCHLGQPKELFHYLDLQDATMTYQICGLMLLTLIYRVYGYFALWYRFAK